MSARRQSQSSSGSGFAAFVVLGLIVWVVSFIIRHIWVILGILVVIGSIYLAKAIAQDNRRRREAYHRYGAELAAKAKQQDAWLAAGDERGIYGPGAVELMRYIKSGGKTAPPTEASSSAVVVPQPLSRARQAAVPAVVAGGVGIALMLAQFDGPGSDSTPSRSTTTRTTAPSATRTPYLPPPRPSYTSTPTTIPTAEPAPTYTPAPTTYTPPPTSEPMPVYAPPPQSTYYRNCRAAHADGRYNIPVGDPAYRSGLDRDGDGYACE
jgi:hypothetical protein